MAETGNPNVYTIYRGKYAVTAPDGNEHYCMLSNTNDVIFMGNYVSDANGLVCTLPEELRPESNLRVPLIVNSTVRMVTIGANGNVTSAYNNATHYLKGFSFNISCNYYAGA